MPKTSTRRKGKTNQAAGTRKTKLNAKGKHCETHEEATTCSAQDLRENVSFINASSWVTINSFITRDTTSAIYVFVRSHPGDKLDNKPRFSTSVSPDVIVVPFNHCHDSSQYSPSSSLFVCCNNSAIFQAARRHGDLILL